MTIHYAVILTSVVVPNVVVPAEVVIQKNVGYENDKSLDLQFFTYLIKKSGLQKLV